MSTSEPLRDAITRAMVEEVEGRTEWEVAPELWRISLRDGQPVLNQIPVPEGLWALARPPQVLEEIARAASNARYYPGQAEDDAEYGPAYGFGFLYEGWAIHSDTMCGSERDQADAAAHRLHTRPDRVEVRLFAAVDRDQITYHVMKSRNGGAFAQVEVHPPGDSHSIGGVVIDALAQLVKGVVGG
jgi:hypothetical protein